MQELAGMERAEAATGRHRILVCHLPEGLQREGRHIFSKVLLWRLCILHLRGH